MAHPVSQDRAFAASPSSPQAVSPVPASIPCVNEIVVSPEAFATIQAALANPAEPTDALKRLMGFRNSVQIELPWPPNELSGHHNVHWRVLQPIKKKHRTWAALATIAADIPTPEGSGDIRVSVTFYPPDKRGDRTNYPNRMKPYFDGIADALKVNDRRFLPTYHFAEPVKNARVVVSIG